jgi:hypothetical protein
MKECKICKNSYPLNTFPFRKETGKHRNECRQCTRKSKAESQKKRGRNINKEKAVARVNRWRKNNPEKIRAASALRRARQKQATPKWLSENHKKEIKNYYRLAWSREMFEGEKFDVDHIVPLTNKSVCGLHVPCNLRVIPKIENMKKHNKINSCNF